MWASPARQDSTPTRSALYVERNAILIHPSANEPVHLSPRRRRQFFDQPIHDPVPDIGVGDVAVRGPSVD